MRKWKQQQTDPAGKPAGLSRAEAVPSAGISLTMSAGVLLVILKLLSLLGGFHTGGRHQYFRSSSPSSLVAAGWRLPGDWRSLRGHSDSRGSGRVPELLPRYCTIISLIISTELAAQFESRVSVCVCQRDNLSTRGASRDPPNVNQIQVDRRWTDRANEPHTAGTSGHWALFFNPLSWWKKERIMSAVIRLS